MRVREDGIIEITKEEAKKNPYLKKSLLGCEFNGKKCRAGKDLAGFLPGYGTTLFYEHIHFEVV